VREGIFSRSPPLATRDLRIVPSRLGDRAGAIGAATMVIEHVLSPDAVDRALGKRNRRCTLHRFQASQPALSHARLIPVAIIGKQP
jgi:hypothetical protein